MFERRQFGTSQRRVIFFVGGYKTRISTYRPLYWVMQLLGYRVYAYVLDPKTVVASHITAYVNQVKAVQQDVASLLNELPNDCRVYVMGNSLGSETALYALKHTQQIRAAFLVTARGSIAEFIWHSPAGSAFKPPYVKNGYSFEQLSAEVQPVEPLRDINLIGDRPIYLLYSARDTIIPASNTQQLTSLSAVITHRYRYGDHLLTTVRGLAAFWRWHRFFKQS